MGSRITVFFKNNNPLQNPYSIFSRMAMQLSVSFMCAYVYVRIHIHIMYICIQNTYCYVHLIYTSIYVYVSDVLCVYICTCVHMSMYIIYIYIYKYKCTCVYMYTYICNHTWKLHTLCTCNIEDVIWNRCACIHICTLLSMHIQIHIYSSIYYIYTHNMGRYV